MTQSITRHYMSCSEIVVTTGKRDKIATAKVAKRNGKPLTVYLSNELSHALASASTQRRVHKSEIVRVAVERLLNDLASGQLELPLGL
jgi:hypothetical protein